MPFEGIVHAGNSGAIGKTAADDEKRVVGRQRKGILFPTMLAVSTCGKARKEALTRGEKSLTENAPLTAMGVA